jgi:hypothetical protein
MTHGVRARVFESAADMVVTPTEEPRITRIDTDKNTTIAADGIGGRLPRSQPNNYERGERDRTEFTGFWGEPQKGTRVARKYFWL